MLLFLIAFDFSCSCVFLGLSSVRFRGCFLCFVAICRVYFSIERRTRSVLTQPTCRLFFHFHIPSCHKQMASEGKMERRRKKNRNECKLDVADCTVRRTGMSLASYRCVLSTNEAMITYVDKKKKFVSN